MVGAPAQRANLSYYYDQFGNLDYQSTGVTSAESFEYDDLHRLTLSTRSIGRQPAVAIEYDYDASGNLTLKDDYATVYHYTGPKPNAVSAVDLVGGAQVQFEYDDNGNLESDGGRAIDYNAFNKPVLITEGSSISTFSYGADLSRYRQHGTAGDKFYIDKYFEVDAQSTPTKYIHYISDVAILTKLSSLSNNVSPDVRYLHKDRLGSTVAVTDEIGNILETRGHDPFGKPALLRR